MWTLLITYMYDPPPPLHLQTLSPEGSGADDFLDALLGESDSSSAPTSPLWSPSTTDSGINDESPTDSTESLQPQAFLGFDTQSFAQPPPLSDHPPASKLPLHDSTPDVSIDIGKAALMAPIYLTNKQMCRLGHGLVDSDHPFAILIISAVQYAF